MYLVYSVFLWSEYFTFTYLADVFIQNDLKEDLFPMLQNQFI